MQTAMKTLNKTLENVLADRGIWLRFLVPGACGVYLIVHVEPCSKSQFQYMENLNLWLVAVAVLFGRASLGASG